ncbi:MAG: cysteine desulfurase family protein [Bacilli bacterium]
MTELYFDYAASCPLHPDVFEAMKPYWFTHFANPSSIHKEGQRARFAVEEARRVCASSIGARPDEIIFTSGGTESDNLALFGSVRFGPESTPHIVTSACEHYAVLQTIRQLERLGAEITYLKPDQNGIHTTAQVLAALKPNTTLVSIMWTNNETGVVQPIEEMATAVKQVRSDVIFHTDAVQAYGTEQIEVRDSGIDLLSTSAHKIGGPNGIGFLYVRQSTKLQKLIFGGAQEHGLRAGSENVPAIVGFAAAVALQKPTVTAEKLRKKKAKLLHALTERGVTFSINGDCTSPHIVSLAFPGQRSDQLLMKLDWKGVRVSAGSACTAGTLQPSHVLEAMYGEGTPKATSTLRISFHESVTEESIESLADVILSAVS